MTLDELPIDHGGVTGAEVRNIAEALLELDMIEDLEAIGLKVRDPFLAAAAIGVAMNVDGQWLRGSRRRTRQLAPEAHVLRRPPNA